MKKRTAGFALIEVLVAFLVLGIGMLGIAKVLLASHKSSTSNYFQIQAAQLAENMIADIRQNNSGTYNYNLASGATLAPPSSSCISSSCNSDSLAAYDLWQWATALQAALPNVSATVSTTAQDADGNNIVSVTITWSDSSAQQIFSTSNQVTNNSTITLVTLL